MKNALLLTISLYWKFIPENSRRNCFFDESCSKYVYRTTEKSGFINGIKALRIRFLTCRSKNLVQVDNKNKFFIVTTRNKIYQIPFAE